MVRGKRISRLLIWALASGFGVLAVGHSMLAKPAALLPPGVAIAIAPKAAASIFRLSPTFIKTYGSFGTIEGSDFFNSSDIQAASDGGFVLACHVVRYGQTDDEYLLIVLKVDREGDVKWRVGQGGLNSGSFARLAALPDGGFLVADSGYPQGQPPGLIRILNIGPDGAIRWVKQYRYGDDPDVWTCDGTKDGGLLLSGSSSIGGRRTTWLFRVDGSGLIDWAKALEPSPDIDEVRESADGGLVIAGTRTTSAAGRSLSETTDTWTRGVVAKLDSRGAVEWSRYLDDSTTADCTAHSLIALPGGGCAVAGIRGELSQPEVMESWICGLDESGQIVWQGLYLDPEGRNSEEPLIAQATDGGFLFVRRSFNAQILRIGPFGGVLWSNRFTGSFGLNAAVSGDVAGWTLVGVESNSENLALIHLDRNGSTGLSCGQALAAPIIETTPSLVLSTASISSHSIRVSSGRLASTPGGRAGVTSTLCYEAGPRMNPRLTLTSLQLPGGTPKINQFNPLKKPPDLK